MKNIFENSFPDIYYLACRWPKSKFLVKKYVMSNQKKPDLYKLCNCCLKDLNFHSKHPLKNSLKVLVKKCSQNPTYNTYHNQHHFKSVIILASIFAKLLNLKNHDKIFLIFLALTHDMNHQGRRIIKKPFYQELITLKNLKPIIFRNLINLKKWNRIQNILLNTYFPKININTNDLVEKILLDVDIISSIIFGQLSGLNLSRRLKHEIKFKKNSQDLYKEFLSHIEKKKLHLDISRDACPI